MNLTTFVDVAIGMCLIYLGASLLVTIANEYIAQVLALRARQLQRDLRKLIVDKKLMETLSKNPALGPLLEPELTGLKWLGAALNRAIGRLPKAASFVDPNVLAQQLLGTLLEANPKAGEAASDGSPALRAIDKWESASPLKPQLAALARVIDTQKESLVQSVGAYLDRSLTAMGEVYKRRMQLVSLGVGLGIAVAFNVDTLVLVEHLYRDKEAREAMVTYAMQVTGSASRDQLDKCLAMTTAERGKADPCKAMAGLVDAMLRRNEKLGKLPIGWADTKASALNVFADQRGTTGPGPWIRWLGLALTAMAVSLGASFWFDLLNRFVNIRHAMRKPEPDAAAGSDNRK